MKLILLIIWVGIITTDIDFYFWGIAILIFMQGKNQ